MEKIKSEILNPKQTRNSKFEIRNLLLIIIWLLVIGHWSLASAAPILSNEEIVSIADDYAIITWQTTNELSTGSIKYGLTLPVSNTTTETFGASTFHYMIIRNLYPNTIYYYKTISVSSTGTTEGTNKSFKTLARPSGNLLMAFAMLSDIHYAPNLANTVNVRGRPYNSSNAIVDALVANINQFGPAFTIIKGDMLDAGATTAVTRVTDLKTKLDSLEAWGPTKYYPIPGNHDKSNPNYGGGNWVDNNLKVLYPSGPAVSANSDSSFNYGFTYNGCRFIMLDSSTSTGVTAEVNLTSLEAELQIARTGKMKAFIFMHHEATEEPDIPSEVLGGVLEKTFDPSTDWDMIRIRNNDAFFNLLRTYKLDNNEPVVAAVYMGHIHDNRRRDFDGIPFIRTSSGLQFPTGFNIVKVYSNGFTQSFFKLPTFSDPVARPCLTGTGEVTKARAEQFYLGGLTYRNFTQTFSALNTVIPPTVEAVQPAAGATGVALNQPIIINFTKPMTKETTVNDWLTVSYNGTNVPLSSSSWSWNSYKTQLTINLALVASKTYTVTIVGGFGNATATDGTFFLTNYPFSFITGTSSSTTPPSASINRIKNEDGLNTDVTTDPSPTFSGVATDESGATISNVEFRYGSPTWSDWYSATPADGAFNSATEPFTFTITNEISVGEHQVQIRTTNAAGVTTAEGFAPYAFYVISNKPQIILIADGSEIVNGDPINPSPSFEVTVVTDQTLSQLWFTIDSGIPVNILPASPSFVTTVSYKPTLTDGKHDVRVEAVDRDSLGSTRTSTKEAVNLMVQTTGDLQVFGTPLSYPNPYVNVGTENTTLSYILSRNSNITLSIHDVAGTTIAKRNLSAGTNGGRAGYNEVPWDGRSDAGDVVGNGIYIYLVIADGKVVAKGKLTVLKR
jgi:hypothetical protein